MDAQALAQRLTHAEERWRRAERFGYTDAAGALAELRTRMGSEDTDLEEAPDRGRRSRIRGRTLAVAAAVVAAAGFAAVVAAGGDRPAAVHDRQAPARPAVQLVPAVPDPKVIEADGPSPGRLGAPDGR